MEKRNRTDSIADRINGGFVLRRLRTFIEIDLIIAISALIVIILYIIDNTSNLSYGLLELLAREKISISGDSYRDVCLLLENDLGIMTATPLASYFDIIKVPVIVLLAYQLASFISAFSYGATIRRKMKPLNDLAIKAQEVSTLSADPKKLEELQEAISSYKIDGKDRYIHTNNKDLDSIELAINNLIMRMKESQKQQNRFISDASHELRTPISVIQGYVNMLDRWGKEDESVLEESIEALKNESEHMKQLIEQLLFLARGDSGRNTLNFIDADLSQIMREVWEESMMIDSDHKYVFDQEEDFSEIKMRGDYGMLKQSIRILIQNAAKYSSPGDTIRLRVGTDQEGHSFYMVQDEGVGMVQADLEHIFERFYRSDEARNKDTGGSGLGLSIAKWIIDAHQGKVEVLSRKDFGTRFTVTF